MVGRCPEGFSDSVALLAASVATGVYRQFPRQDFHLQETRHLFTARGIIQARAVPKSCRAESRKAPRDSGLAAVDTLQPTVLEPGQLDDDQIKDARSGQREHGLQRRGNALAVSVFRPESCYTS